MGTFPEYSGQGLMNKLLLQALTNMRAKKQSISYLYPYSIPYYRRKGWEIISDKIVFEVQDFQLPKNKPVPGDVARVEPDSEDVKVAYERFSMQTHGAMLRKELAWSEYWRWDSDDLTAAVYYGEDGQPDGYILYWIEEEVFHVKDMIFIHEEARSGLWNFISAHFSMISKVVGNIHTDEQLAFCWKMRILRKPFHLTLWHGSWTLSNLFQNIRSNPQRWIESGPLLCKILCCHGIKAHLL